MSKIKEFWHISPWHYLPLPSAHIWAISYTHLILDEKIAVMDSVDARAAEEWLSNVAQVLEGRNPDYLVVTHMEPDHSGSLMRLAQTYPEMKIVGNAKTFTLIKQFFGTGALSEDRMREVGERDTLSLGLHRLRFLLAPMVHWPEVMAAYEEEEKILFSADAFGRFGSLERTARAPWAPQARRYYYNIVGKYGAQVQACLLYTSPHAQVSLWSATWRVCLSVICRWRTRPIWNARWKRPSAHWIR